MRILFVTARPPWPQRRGDQVRVAGLTQKLSAEHEVRIVAQRWPRQTGAVSPEGIALRTVPISALRLLLGLFSAAGRPLQVALHNHRTFSQAVRREVAEFRPDVAAVVLSRLGDVLGALAGLPVVLDLIDALALNMHRRAERQPGLAGVWSWESRRMARWDHRLIVAAQRATVVSERDRRAVWNEDEQLARKVKVVPLGLPLHRHDPYAVARRPIVSLTGNLGYFPTVDGALWFAREVWPRVRQYEPAAEWWLAGARPAGPVRALAALPGVRLIPNPDDLRSVAHQSAVAIAPLRAGSGTPIKILEAMAWSRPVVSTHEGALGLDDLPIGAIALADRPEDFAQSVARLLADRELAYRQTVKAWRWLQKRHDLELVASYFEAVLREAVAEFTGQGKGGGAPSPRTPG